MAVDSKKPLNGDGVLYLWQKILNVFVKKESGKGLSTNDYTTEEKTKLAGLNNYTLPTATNDTLGGVKVGSGLSINNGVLSADSQVVNEEDPIYSASPAATITNDMISSWTNKADASDIPTVPTNVSSFTNDANYITVSDIPSIPDSTSDLTNDSGFITSSDIPEIPTVPTNVSSFTNDANYVTNDVMTGMGYQTQEQVSSAISTAVASAVKYKGTVADMTALEAITTKENGDMYNVAADDMNYVWNATDNKWDPQAPTVTLEFLTNAEIDEIINSVA